MKKFFSGLKITTAVLLAAIFCVLYPMQTIAHSGIISSPHQSDVSYSASGETAFSEEEIQNKPYIIGEDVSKRQASAKHFLMSDGSEQVAEYPINVHYLNEDGQWEQYDNRIQIEQPGARSASVSNVQSFKAAKSDKEITLAPQGSAQELIKLENNSVSASWKYINANQSNLEITPVQQTDNPLELTGIIQEVFYREIYPDVDLQVLLIPGGVKENLILKNAQAQNTFEIEYALAGLQAVPKDSRTIELKNSDGEIKYIISAPYMEDAQGAASPLLELSLLSQTEEKLVIRLTADNSWLQAQERAYPVTIDPTFQTPQVNSNIQSTFISQGLPNDSFGYGGNNYQGSLYVGKFTSAAANNGVTRTLIKMSSLPSLSPGDVIINAQVYLLRRTAEENYKPMYAYRMTSSWDQSTATWNNSNNKYDSSSVIDYDSALSEDSWTYRCWDITKLMRQWYENPSSNYGIMLKSSDESVSSKFWAYSTHNSTGLRPTFLITYRNNDGLEPYWEYASQNIGHGSSHVNLFSGNLIYTLPLTSGTGAKMPVSLELTYSLSSAYKDASQGIKTAYGWHLNMARRINTISQMTQLSSSVRESLQERGYEYVWIDSDGTAHYLKKDGSVYKDEDGLGLTLSVGSSGNEKYTLESKTGEKETYNTNGYLYRAYNTQGHHIQCSYDSSNILNKVTDGAGRDYIIHSSSGRLNKITCPDGSEIALSSGSTLTKVTYDDGSFTSFEYSYTTMNTSIYMRMVKAAASDGQYLSYNYKASSGHMGGKVASVTEWNGEPNQSRNYVRFNYGSDNTTTVYYGSQIFATSSYYMLDKWHDVYTFDNLGRTTSILNSDGTMSNGKYAQVNQDSAEEMSKSNNRLASASEGEKYVNNIAPDHSFENGSGWWYQSNWYNDNGTQTWDDTVSYLGYKSYKITQDDPTPGKISMAMGNVPVSPGETYTLSGYFKVQSVSNMAANGGAGLFIAFHDASGDNKIGEEAAPSMIKEATNGEWKRISMTFTVPQNASYLRIYAGLYLANGTLWFDCIQLEESDTMSDYNMLVNSSFDENANNWVLGRDIAGSGWSSGRYMIKGNLEGIPYIYQHVNIDRPQISVKFSGTVQADAVPNTTGGRDICMELEIKYKDGSFQWYNIHFNYDTTAKQYKSDIFTTNPDKEVDRIRFFMMFYRQPDAAYFDELMLTFDQTGSAYTYDSKGNLISASDNAQRNQAYTFNSANELVQLTNENNETYKYFYTDANRPHRLTAARSQQRGNGFTYSYNSSDVLIQTSMGVINENGALDTSKPYISSSQLYDVNNNYVNSSQDQRGNITSYLVNSNNGVVSKIVAPNGNETNYSYNDHNYLTSVSATASQGIMHTVGYTYDQYWRLKKIAHNGFDYDFVYDKWGNVTSVSAGGSLLSSNEYALKDGLLAKTTYGSGDYIEYLYDNYDRVTAKKLNGSVIEEYIYNNKGQTARCIDHAAGFTYEYSYDMLSRLIEARRSDGVSYQYSYDKLNRLTKKIININGEKHVQNYSYTQDSLLYATDFSSGASNLRVYDSLNRLTNLNTLFPTSGLNPQRKILNQTFEYENVSGQRTTNLISSHYVGFNNSADQPLFTHSYSYDANGNISSLSKLADGQTSALSYQYDGLDQLIRVNDQEANKTVLYSYDAGGNITSAKTYPYSLGELSGSPLSEKSYSYASSGWKDLLINFNGDDILYDEIGNPLQYRDGMAFAWQYGRRLASVSQGSNAYSYSYDASGVRLAKTINGSSYNYIYDNGVLLYADTPLGGMTFIYDNDSVIGYKYNSAYYFYLKNLQGDILGAVDASGNLLYQYRYDAWGVPAVLDAQGNPISPDSAHIANANPLRYRGYFFDSETGLYYVSSRYYDPEVGRWINTDSQLNISLGVLGCNMFAYCLNNPVNKVDYGGNKPGDLFDTMDEAAIDAAEYLGELTWKNTWEYSTAIYTVNTTVKTDKIVTKTYRFLWWTWTRTSIKTIGTRVTKYTYKAVITDKKNNSVRVPNAPLFKKRVAALHTHPMGSWAGITRFSDADKRWADYHKIPLYVHGPNGHLRKYDPATREDILIYSDLPISPKKPWLD